MKEILQQFKQNYLIKYWNPVAAVIAAGLISAYYFGVTGTYWAVTGEFTRWGGHALQALGVDISDWSYYKIIGKMCIRDRFIGAKPYQQAYERGVKIIGATAHFINNELDQGPIIMQNVINVDHTYSADAMMRAGRDVEKTVLSRALDLALHDRIFVYKNKTVVL